MSENQPTGRRLTFRDLQKQKGIRESRMTIWRRMRDKEFPQSFVDHGRCFWWEDEIDLYLAGLTKLPRGPGRTPPPKKDAGHDHD